jgi:hypothetical protein
MPLRAARAERLQRRLAARWRCENRLVTQVDSSSAAAKPGRGSEVEEALLEGLRQGDDRVFADLVQDWSSVMLRLALVHVDSRAVAEEVVQEAWLTVLRDIDRFERRSSLRTWVLGIVVNRARARARVSSDGRSRFPPT